MNVSASTKYEPGLRSWARVGIDQATDQQEDNELTVYWIPITL